MFKIFISYKKIHNSSTSLSLLIKLEILNKTLKKKFDTLFPFNPKYSKHSRINKSALMSQS